MTRRFARSSLKSWKWICRGWIGCLERHLLGPLAMLISIRVHTQFQQQKIPEYLRLGAGGGQKREQDERGLCTRDEYFQSSIRRQRVSLGCMMSSASQRRGFLFFQQPFGLSIRVFFLGLLSLAAADKRLDGAVPPHGRYSFSLPHTRPTARTGQGQQRCGRCITSRKILFVFVDLFLFHATKDRGPDRGGDWRRSRASEALFLNGEQILETPGAHTRVGTVFFSGKRKLEASSLVRQPPSPTSSFPPWLLVAL
jgi:hypothetical protein